MNVFDFHCHPALKALFASNDFEQHAWRNAKGSINGILASQCSLALLAEEHINLICAAFHAPERAMTSNWLVFFVAAQLRGWDMDSERIRRMGAGELPYFFLLREDLRILQKSPSDSSIPETVKVRYNNRKVKLIRSMKEYNPSDKLTLHVVPSVEGSHCFFKFHDNLKESSVDFEGTLTNFKEFLNQTGRLFSLNLTHLSHNPFCNHAYGLKLINDRRFFPQGNGISSEGLRLIDLCQGKTTQNNIYIDIKHMSLGARLQYYAYRREKHMTSPIVATHIGVTGFSLKDIESHIIHLSLKETPKISYIRTYSTLPNGEILSFYPLSINLYDEDILEILLSDGLLGLSLDQRILGINATSDPIDVEYISKAELQHFVSADKITTKTDESRLRATRPQLDAIQMRILENDSLKQIAPNHAHGKYFMINLLHIIKIAQDNRGLFSHLPGFNAWDKICIGSDFDGLIDPLDLCRNVNEFTNLRAYLLHNLMDYTSYCSVSLEGLKPEEVADKLFFQNGLNFMTKYYN